MARKIKNILSLLMPTWPREVFRHRRIVRNMDEFLDVVNVYNGVTHIYYSLYSCTETHDFSNTVIDKIAFDFDAEDPAEKKNEVLRLHEWALNNNYEHIVLFSGKKGFHFIVFSDGNGVKNKKDALYNAHAYIVKETKISPDPKIFGDIKRVLRVPNTYHPRGKRYCIPITEEDLKKNFESIKDKAKRQVFEAVVYGGEKFPLINFDRPCERSRFHIEMKNFDYDVKINDGIADKFLPCVKCWIKNVKNNNGEEMGNWQARYLFCIYCRDIGLPIKTADAIARKYFGVVKRTDGNWTNYDHMRAVKALELAYSGENTFWNCDTLFARGLCKGKCPFYKRNGSPLYK